MCGWLNEGDDEGDQRSPTSSRRQPIPPTVRSRSTNTPPTAEHWLTSVPTPRPTRTRIRGLPLEDGEFGLLHEQRADDPAPRLQAPRVKRPWPLLVRARTSRAKASAHASVDSGESAGSRHAGRKDDDARIAPILRRNCRTRSRALRKAEESNKVTNGATGYSPPSSCLSCSSWKARKTKAATNAPTRPPITGPIM